MSWLFWFSRDHNVLRMVSNFLAKLFFHCPKFQKRIELPKFWAEFVRVLPLGKTLAQMDNSFLIHPFWLGPREKIELEDVFPIKSRRVATSKCFLSYWCLKVSFGKKTIFSEVRKISRITLFEKEYEKFVPVLRISDL